MPGGASHASITTGSSGMMGRVVHIREEDSDKMPRYERTLWAGSAYSRFSLPLADGFNKPIARRALSLFVGLLLVAGGMVLNMGTYSTAASPSTPVMYYVAMGDSLAAGAGASETPNDYVNLLYQHELTRYPSLQLLNLSCSGATTTDVLSGGGGCSYTTGTQLGDAEAFLRAHPGQIAFLTIDIGFDNVLPCLYFFGMSGIDGQCAQNKMNVVSAGTSANPRRTPVRISRAIDLRHGLLRPISGWVAARGKRPSPGAGVRAVHGVPQCASRADLWRGWCFDGRPGRDI